VSKASSKKIEDALQAAQALADVVADAKPLTPEEARRKRKRVKRRANPRAAFHMSKASVGFNSDDLAKMTELDAVYWLAEAQWGSRTEMPCPHCGTIDKHYFTRSQLRWKCKACDARFSVTSKTVFADRKLPLTKILRIAFDWSAGASGVPALQLRRNWNVTYSTVFTLAHKLREGLVRGNNIGAVAGVNEMDGMDVIGRRGYEKRGNPSDKVKPLDIPPELKKPGVDENGNPLPAKFEKNARQNPARRLMLVMCQRGVSAGTGSSATRVTISVREQASTVKAFAQIRASAESIMMTDEDNSYAAFSGLFAEHNTVNHSKEYSNGNGVSNNQAESFNARMRRSVEGIYLNPSHKYLMEYACENAWRQDVRKLSTGRRLCHLFGKAMWVGHSRWWCNYTHGENREYEMLIEGNQPVATRGKPKGYQHRLPR
jgi:transposase-like protein